MVKLGFHLHPRLSPSLPTFLLLLRTQTLIPDFRGRSIFISNRRFDVLLLSCRRLRTVPSYRRWDSNAESYSTGNFNFDGDDESDDFDDSVEQWAEALEDYIDSIWILKVFGSYGWMLPAIILSLLLANGPKAFLMALVLPIGQSTFAFAIQRFQNRGKVRPKVKNKNKTKTKMKKGRSRAYSSRNVPLDKVAEWIGSQGRPRKKKKEYQSWVYKNDVSVSNGRDNSAGNFGGWDELDAGMDSYAGPSRREPRKSSGLHGIPAEKAENERLGKSNGPLLLRLLISVFPFLSSWIEVL